MLHIFKTVMSFFLGFYRNPFPSWNIRENPNICLNFESEEPLNMLGVNMLYPVKLYNLFLHQGTGWVITLCI